MAARTTETSAPPTNYGIEGDANESNEGDHTTGHEISTSAQRYTGYDGDIKPADYKANRMWDFGLKGYLNIPTELRPPKSKLGNSHSANKKFRVDISPVLRGYLIDRRMSSNI